MARPTIVDLPTEILEAIILYLDPPSLICFSRANKFIKNLTADAPIIWRNLCRTQFKSWDWRHDIETKFAGPLSDVDWRSLYIQRVKTGDHTRKLLDGIINSQLGRIERINEIARYGTDVKDILLEEKACPKDRDDILARYFYATAVLERINRETAIRIWEKIRDGKNVPIEEALGAFDVFACVGGDVGTDVIAGDLDKLAAGVFKEYPGFSDLSPRLQASTLATFLREQGFRGVPDTSYRALGNSFIGLVLRSASHQSLPLISVAIYCALARRVGLDARPCGFIFHVYTLVYARPSHNLDGEYKPTSSSQLEYMYLDPFRSSDEVQKYDLVRTLRDLGVPHIEQSSFLSDADITEMVLRTARNIMNSVQTIRQSEAGHRNVQPTWMLMYPDMDNAFYSTIWSMLLLTPGDIAPRAGTIQPRQYLPYLLEHFQTHFPWDVGMLEDHVIPMFRHTAEGAKLSDFVEQMRHDDAALPVPIRRDATTASVKFRVGQLFQHRRYSYEGVITGWDTNCDAGEEWIASMGVDRLPNGREQAFYHVL